MIKKKRKRKDLYKEPFQLPTKIEVYHLHQCLHALQIIIDKPHKDWIFTSYTRTHAMIASRWDIYFSHIIISRKAEVRKILQGFINKFLLMKRCFMRYNPHGDQIQNNINADLREKKYLISNPYIKNLEVKIFNH